MGSVQNADSGPLCCNPDCEQRRHCCRGESSRPRTPLRLSHPLRCAQPLWLQRRLQICHQEKQGSAQPVSDPWWQNGACLPQPWAEVFQVQELQQHHSQGHLQGTSWGLSPTFTPGNWTAGGAGQICAQVICCGSDGVTYPTPCSTPEGVTCVDYNECPAPQPPLPPVGCPGCPVTGGAVLSPENQAIVDWTVEGLQGSDGLCKKTKVEVNNFSTQVVAGTMYEFDLVLDHAEDSAAECGAPDGLREVCHMAVWEKVWEDFREVQWDRSTCIRPGTN